MLPPPPRSTLFPYTTLFRSCLPPGPPQAPSGTAPRSPSPGRGPAPPSPAPRRGGPVAPPAAPRSEEHTSELQSRRDLVCRLLLEKKKNCLTPPPSISPPLPA